MAASMSALAAGRPRPNPPTQCVAPKPPKRTSEGTNPAVGYAVARRLGVEVDEERALALRLQWLNTPRGRAVV